jgi:mitogen-activated protein kinase kinase kinase
LHNNASEDVARGDWEDLEDAVDHATVQNNQDKYIDNEQQRKVRLQHHTQRTLVATTSTDATEKGLSGDKEWKDAPVSERIDWRKGAQIGKGTFGNVFVGLNASTGERFAVKQIGLVDGSRAEVARLEREILLMKRLRHKHIVQYLGTARDTHALFIFMEYVPGGSIASMLGQYGAFGEALTRRLVAQIVSGIAYLHSMGIIHRDVKGANVLVTNNGIAKLADFGCSRQLQDLQTAASVSLENSLKNITGSVPWMAPEVIKQSGRLPKAADVWSLGATIIEMATAAHPWPEFSNQLAALFHVATATQPPSLPSSMSNVGKDFVTRCLAIDEKQRATAEELLQHPFIAQEVAMENGNDPIGGEEATASSLPLRPGKRNHGGQSEGKAGKDGREPALLP